MSSSQSRSTGSLEDPDLIKGLESTSLVPIPHHHIKAYLTAIPFTQYNMSSYQEKIPTHTKSQKTYFEETKQASAPDRAEMMELSDQEFKTTMINVLRTLDRQHVSTDGQCK